MKKYLLILSCVLIAGIFSSCGRNDFQIQTEIKEAVMYEEPGLNIIVNNGVVNVSGTVSSEESKKEIVDLITNISGVKSINEDMEIYVAPVRVSAEDVLRTTVTKALNDAELGEGIEVKVEEGAIVTLSGKATKANQKKIMKVMDGIKTSKVINEMK